MAFNVKTTLKPRERLVNLTPRYSVAARRVKLADRRRLAFPIREPGQNKLRVSRHRLRSTLDALPDVVPVRPLRETILKRGGVKLDVLILSDHRAHFVPNRHAPFNLGDVALDTVFPCRLFAELSTLDRFLGGDHRQIFDTRQLIGE